MHPLRAALAGLIDYAGLFPPATLSLPSVVANHQRYIEGAHSWLLGRLIVPLAALADMGPLLSSPGPAAPWTISVLARTEDDLDRLAEAVAAFNDRQRTAAVVAVELAAATVGEIDRRIALVPERYERYVEVPLSGRLPDLLDAAAANGCYAKLRSGGVEAAAFPDPADVARFLAACAAREVPVKATAGLHHPVRGSYRLTYEPQSPAAIMHGFVNLVAAAGLLALRRIDERTAADVLATTDPSAFTVEHETLAWRGHGLTIDDCVYTRAHVLRSVGSCSFEEPVEDLSRLGWLP